MFDFLFKLLDFLLAGVLEKRLEKKAVVSEFETLKRRVLSVSIVNDLPVELHKLRIFFIEKGFAECPGVTEFFSKWLTALPVVEGKSAPNVFSSSDIEKLKEQLYRLRL